MEMPNCGSAVAIVAKKRPIEAHKETIMNAGEKSRVIQATFPVLNLFSMTYTAYLTEISKFLLGDSLCKLYNYFTAR
jgi:hypothetical protein